MWNRALPWFATRTATERCDPADVRLTAVQDGVVVGVAQVAHAAATAHCRVAVDPPHRGQGIGSALVGELANHVTGAVTVFEHDPADPAAHRLAERRGLRPGSPMLALWSLEPRVGASRGEPGWDVGPWTEVRSGDLTVLAEAVRWWATDNPLDEALIAQWQDSLSAVADPWTTVARDGDGQIFGVAWAEEIPYTSYVRATHLAVMPDHRGRGMGLRLKRAQAQWALRAGKELIVTQIAPGNRANQIWASAGGSRRDQVGFTRSG